ncbi:hypothetical protein AB0M64_35135 [Streptomyces sp. NPDC051771]|uniref:hypothetical protein n=1 Tax=Streptomyces sp. NPDC051771 TaxID=3154847 RepID=UPI003412CE79
MTKQLHLYSLSCRKTEDATGMDDIILRVNGITRWSGRITDGQTVDISSIDTIVYGDDQDVRIELYESDVEGDDFLGFNSVSNYPVGIPFFLQYSLDEADYTIKAALLT